jgi:hypothetical protein
MGVLGGLFVDVMGRYRDLECGRERESGLAAAGRSLDMKVMDAAGDKIEIGPSSLDFTLNGY